MTSSSVNANSALCIVAYVRKALASVKRFLTKSKKKASTEDVYDEWRISERSSVTLSKAVTSSYQTVVYDLRNHEGPKVSICGSQALLEYKNYTVLLRRVCKDNWQVLMGSHLFWPEQEVLEKLYERYVNDLLVEDFKE